MSQQVPVVIRCTSCEHLWTVYCDVDEDGTIVIGMWDDVCPECETQGEPG